MSNNPPSLINLEPLTAPAVKLIESISAAVGAIYEPTRIRRKAKAEADAKIVQAEADVKASLISAQGSIEMRELALRASERINVRELRRQRNIESIINKALHQLPEIVNEEPVDEDWVVEFFNLSQDIGNEQMQSLWSKVLAGEVAAPGSYSPRTLQVIKTLRQSDASRFQLMANYIWSNYYHFFTSASGRLLTQKGLPHEKFLELESIGLINMQSSAIFLKPNEQDRHLRYFDKVHHVSIQTLPDGIDDLRLYAYVLTDVGGELLPLCDVEPDEEYRTTIVKDWEKRGVEVRVTQADPSTL